MKRLLIVDDNRDAADILGVVFQASPHPFEVRIVYSGEEALAIVQKFNPDVVILDIAMPKLNGFTVGERLRKLHPGCGIFLLSGYGDRETVERSEREGFPHLIKPADPEKLIEMVLKKCSHD